MSEYSIHQQKEIDDIRKERDRWRFASNQLADAVKRTVMADDHCFGRAQLMDALDIYMEARLGH
jgi:hypothetical protein